MKTQLLLLPILFINSFFIYSQTHSISAKVGTTISNSTESNVQIRKPISSLNYGLGYQNLLFKKKLIIAIELEYLQLGFKSDEKWKYNMYLDDPQIYHGERIVNYKSTYLCLPVKIGVNFGEKLYFQPRIGLSMSKLLFSPNLHYDELYPTKKYRITNYDASIIAEVCSGLKLGDNFSTELSIAYQRGLIDYIKYTPFNSKDYHRSLSVNLGLRYYL